MTMQIAMPEAGESIEDRLSIRKLLTAGLTGVAVLLAAVIIWGVYATIDSSVISTGSVRTFLKPQSIQHADGGHVAKINVRNGDMVDQGDVLVVLDDTIIKAGLAILERQIADLTVANYRLKLERSNADAFGTPEFEFSAQLPMVESEQIIAGQRALFAARLENRDKQLMALDTRISQIAAQNEGNIKLIATRDRQRQNTQEQLTRLEQLEKDGLATATQVLSQRQTLEDINGTMQELENSLVENESRKAELDANKARIDIEWFERAEQQLAENEVRLSELKQRRLVEASRLNRVSYAWKAISANCCRPRSCITP